MRDLSMIITVMLSSNAFARKDTPRREKYINLLQEENEKRRGNIRLC